MLQSHPVLGFPATSVPKRKEYWDSERSNAVTVLNNELPLEH